MRTTLASRWAGHLAYPAPFLLPPQLTPSLPALSPCVAVLIDRSLRGNCCNPRPRPGQTPDKPPTAAANDLGSHTAKFQCAEAAECKTQRDATWRRLQRITDNYQSNNSNSCCCSSNNSNTNDNRPQSECPLATLSNSFIDFKWPKWL